jgi:LDH2 family malate/lactate/ureidoglycolate dehydrogenase
MNDFASILMDSPPIDPSKPVIVPGSIELDRMAQQRQSGIEISLETIKQLQKYTNGS